MDDPGFRVLGLMFGSITAGGALAAILNLMHGRRGRGYWERRVAQSGRSRRAAPAIPRSIAPIRDDDFIYAIPVSRLRGRRRIMGLGPLGSYAMTHWDYNLTRRLARQNRRRRR